MIFAPHTLQRETAQTPKTDKFGRVIASDATDWEIVCRCRCDDDSTTELISPNGSVYRATYHVVCEGNVSLNAGDKVRCMTGNNVRGEGVIGKIKKTNYLSYTEIWL